MLRGLVATTVVAIAFAAPGAAANAPLLGVAEGRLFRVDSDSLRPLPGPRVLVGTGGCASRDGGTACWTVPAWSFSPDRKLLAVARSDAVTPSLRLIDAQRLRVVADLAIGGQVGGLAWLTRGRLLAIEDVDGTQRLLTIDVARRRVLGRRTIGGTVLRAVPTPRTLVLLLAPTQGIGAARIGVAGADGVLRSAELDHIQAGSKLLGTGSHRIESRLPALAVDAVGRRAFVAGQTVVAEVGLNRLAVTYRRAARVLSSPAKQATGYARAAQWLGGGILAVSGSDFDEQAGSRPSGLVFFDTRTWAARVVDTDATGFVLARDVLLVQGPSGRWGITGYDLDGGKRYVVLPGVQAWVAQVNGRFAYLGSPRADGGRLLRVLDVESGQIVGERDVRVWLVTKLASGWWSD